MKQQPIRIRPEYARLVKLVRSGLPFRVLCDRLDLSPKKAEALIKGARRAGYAIDWAHDTISIRLPQPKQGVQHVPIPPAKGQRQGVLVVSDLHLGSLYALKEQIRDCISWGYDRLRALGDENPVCLIPGDCTDGCYRHGRFEVSSASLEGQTAELRECLPQKPGLTYHATSGNHDDTWADEVGIDPCAFYAQDFRAHGRQDFFGYGRRGAFIDVRGVVFHLFHPRGPNPYAKSYELQKVIEGYMPGQKPDVLLAGHRHFFSYIIERGVHGIACPTFQMGSRTNGSAFSRSLKGQAHIGGLVLSWKRTSHGTLRDVDLSVRSYYIGEKTRRLQRAA